MSIELSEEEIIIYSKQINLEKIGIEGQKKIKRTKILVIGAGGLGCPLLIYLVTSGIGCIGIIDKDIIEKSNLNRQILYKIDDINIKKVQSAKINLHQINKKCKIITHDCEINKYNTIEIISYYNIIIDATDNFTTRYILDETCYKLNKIYIYGAVSEFEGQIAVFNYKSGIRYNNLYKKKPELAEDDCNSRGMMGITTGYIGTLQAIETLKIILGLNKKCKNNLYIHNIINLTTKIKSIKLIRAINNNIESKYYTDKNKTYLLVKKNHKSNEKHLIIDLKNEEEFKKQHVYQSVNIPLNRINMPQTINLLKKYEKKNNIILYCNNIYRSTIASQFLQKKKINHVIMQTKNRNLVD